MYNALSHIFTHMYIALGYDNKLTLFGKVYLLSKSVADSVLIFSLKIGHHCKYT